MLNTEFEIMKKVVLFCLLGLIFLVIGCGSASPSKIKLWQERVAEQNTRTLPEYAKFMDEKLGITCTMPRNFIDQKQLRQWRIHQNRDVAFVYTPVLRSKDKQCIILYPFYPVHTDRVGDTPCFSSRERKEIEELMKKDSTILKTPNWKVGIPRSIIYSEIRAALDIDYRAWIDPDKHITVLAGKEARNLFNADSVFIYDIPMDKPYEEKYVHCTGLAISKANRPVLYLKWFFTNKGKKKEKKYLDLIKKTIWYGDIPKK